MVSHLIDYRVLTVINGHPPVMFGPGAGEDEGREDFAMIADLALPIIRIDYILTTSEIELVDTWLGDDGGSDHMLVLATLSWRREG